MEWIPVLIALFLSAFFSASEIAFVAADKLHVEVRARQRGFIGRLAQRFAEDPARFLTTTLVGNNIALVVYSTLMALLLTVPISTFYSNTVGVSESMSEILTLISQSLIAGTIVLIAGEIIPKTIVQAFAVRAVFLLVMPLAAAYRLLQPLVMLAMWTSKLVLQLVRANATRYAQFPRRQFEITLEESRKAGVLELKEEESEILSNLFDLPNKKVKESMTPRTDMIAVDETTSVETLREKYIEFGYSKIPVFQDNIDNITGIVFAHDLFRSPASIKEITRPAKFVPETKASMDLLREFRETHSSICIVIDEYGGTAGLITREDLLEELFGDIQDEFDSEDVVMRRIDPSTILAEGRAEIDELNDRFDLSIPEGDYETLAGYVINHLGTIPSPLDELTIGELHVVIQKASPHRIELMRISPVSDPPL